MTDQAQDQAETETPDAERIDKLYKKLDKIIARLRDDTGEEELAVSMRSLFATFREINKYERDRLQPGEEFEELSLQRIYQLASAGGEAGEADELRSANAAFAEENELLSATVNSLTFQIETLRRQAADEILQREGQDPMPLSTLQETLTQVSQTIATITQHTSLLMQAPAESDSSKPLVQRFADAINGFTDITPEMLEMTPATPSWSGRLLRRLGFAYDHKDVTAARQLVLTLLKTSETLCDFRENTLPQLAEQMEVVRHNLSLVELYAGHGERQTPQYKEAMEEIDRLRGQMSLRDERQGTLDELEERLKAQDEEILARQADLAELQSNMDLLLEPLAEKDRAIEALHTEHKQELQDFSDNHDRVVAQLTRQIGDLEAQHRTALADSNNRIRDIQNGLLVEKLESEVSALREIAGKADEQLAKEREERLALDARIGNWLRSDEEQSKVTEKWQKLAVRNASTFATVAGVGALGGYGLSSALQMTTVPYELYIGLSVGIPSIIVGGLSFWEDKSITEGAKGLGGTALICSVIAALGSPALIVMENRAERTVEKTIAVERSKLAEENKAFLTACADSPCQIVTDKDGKTRVMVYAKDMDGKRITFDFTQAGKPRMVTEEPLIAPPPPKAPAKPAAP